MDIEQAIINKVDIVDYIGKHTELVNMHDGFRGACPIHGGTNKTSLLTLENRYTCFACGSKGNIVNFVADLNKISYEDAIVQLADELNIDVSGDEKFVKQRDYVAKSKAMADRCHRGVDQCSDYLKNTRGLTDKTINEFNLGYYNGSVVIPLRDSNGRNVAFAWRRFNKEPKYTNSRNNDFYEKGNFLFNMDKAKRMCKDTLFMVEGYFDCMSVHQSGVACVAYCGIEMTKDHIFSIAKIAKDSPYMNVVICPDNDDKAMPLLPKMREKFIRFGPRLNVRVAILPDGIKDLNDYTVAGKSIEDLPTESVDEYVLKMLLAKCRSKQAKYNLVEDYIKTVSSQMVLLDIAEYLSKEWNRKIEDIQEWLKISAEERNIFDIVKEFKTAEDGIRECKELFQTGSVGLGFPSLDKDMKVRKGEVTMIAGYAGIAKTFVAIHMALHLVLREKKRGIFFSLEMSAASLYERIIAMFLKVSTIEVQEMINNGDEKVFTILEAIQKRLYVVDVSHLSLSDIQKRIDIANTRIFDQEVDFIIIDYLQYMKGTRNFEEISQTARDLKPLAKDNNIIVICLSQLSRAGNSWSRPTLQMLKGSGDIEATADWILVFWKPAKDPAITLEDKMKLKDVLMMGVEKARRGIGVDEYELIFNSRETTIRESYQTAA